MPPPQQQPDICPVAAPTPVPAPAHHTGILGGLEDFGHAVSSIFYHDVPKPALSASPAASSSGSAPAIGSQPIHCQQSLPLLPQQQLPMPQQQQQQPAVDIPAPTCPTGILGGLEHFGHAVSQQQPVAALTAALTPTQQPQQQLQPLSRQPQLMMPQQQQVPVSASHNGLEQFGYSNMHVFHRDVQATSVPASGPIESAAGAVPGYQKELTYSITERSAHSIALTSFLLNEHDGSQKRVLQTQGAAPANPWDYRVIDSSIESSINPHYAVKSLTAMQSIPESNRRASSMSMHSSTRNLVNTNGYAEDESTELLEHEALMKSVEEMQLLLQLRRSKNAGVHDVGLPLQAMQSKDYDDAVERLRFVAIRFVEA